MDTIYIDELFILNLITDYLIILASARVCGAVLKRLRYWLAALLGALYACAFVLPGCAFLSEPIPKLACGTVMAVISFSPERRPFRCTVVFFAVSAAFGGAVWACSMLSGAVSPGGYLPISLKVLLPSFAVCYAMADVVFRRAAKNADRRIITVAAVFCGRSAVFRALRDTGNELFDPVTGREVLVVSPGAASALLPEGCKSALCCADPVEALEKLCAVPGLEGRFRLIPYSAVGVSSGLLPAFTPDSVTTDGKACRDVMIAVSPALAENDEYEAVF
jgi:stage II sporulation protein GA (sporulation sigma-E factor processing peptidase)